MANHEIHTAAPEANESGAAKGAQDALVADAHGTPANQMLYRAMTGQVTSAADSLPSLQLTDSQNADVHAIQNDVMSGNAADLQKVMQKYDADPKSFTKVADKVNEDLSGQGLTFKYDVTQDIAGKDAKHDVGTTKIWANAGGTEIIMSSADGQTAKVSDTDGAKYMSPEEKAAKPADALKGVSQMGIKWDYDQSMLK